MRFFFRYLIPISYFQGTRLNRLALVAYNGLIEWLPAIVLSLVLNNFDLTVLWTVALSYLAFISIYEIGYITNDQISERYEEDPRGRLEGSRIEPLWIAGLIAVRLAVFALCTYLLGAWSTPIWVAFHGTLAVTFLLHNLLPRDLRLVTFFALSTYRFFAPIILTIAAPQLVMLLPVILLNNSLYRLTVYIDNKKITERQSLVSKFAFYVSCLPLGTLFSVIYGSLLPIAVTLYFILVWLFYFTFSKVTGRDLRG